LEAAAAAERVSPREVALVAARFRAAEAESGWAAAPACSQVRLLVAVADFRELADEFLGLAVDSLAPVVEFLVKADEPVVDFPAPVAGSLERADEPEAGSLVLAADSLAPVAGSLGRADEPEAGSLERADEPVVELLVTGVEFLVTAADFRARAAACGSAAVMADLAEAHSLVRAVDSREQVAQPGSPEPARSGALAVDCRVPLVSQVVLRSADSAALPAAFLLRAAVADSRAALRLCWPVGLERASHSAWCERQPGRASCGPQELLEPTEPSSLRPVCLQASPVDAPKVSQQD
jgi:hypothetical protein